VNGLLSLPEAIARCAADLAPGACQGLVDALQDGAGRDQLIELVASDHYRAVIQGVIQAWSASPDTSSEALALALKASASAIRRGEVGTVSVVWSGPPTHTVPVRRTDQALLELIRGARARLVVVSFAVYRVETVASALVAAAERGVDVAVVLESAIESGGSVRYEMAAALGNEVAECAKLYSWPASRRPRNKAGSLASLHAKCAVADDATLLISSANLTESALQRNMELGLLVRGGPIPARVHRHFETLIATGDLATIPS
jgi:phosphatidylserine/phosphatidylglycerophosphate/cardiolipin synthase-like enzyme